MVTPPAPPPPCFLKGTMILTPSGEVAVEHLKIGDLVTTHDGEIKPIRWIGRRRFTSEKGNWPAKFVPVRIRKNALGPASPKRDLHLSPGHMLYIDGVLVPVKYLVDDEQIAAVPPEAGTAIEYFHIELEEHDLLVSDGAPSGSLRAGPLKRERFGNFAEYARLYPDDKRGKPKPYAEICPSGIGAVLKHIPGVPHGCPKIAAIRKRLAARASEPAI